MTCPVAASIFAALQQAESIPPWRKFRAPEGFHLISPRLCAQEQLVARICASGVGSADVGIVRRLLLVLTDLIQSGEQPQPPCCRKDAAGADSETDDVACESLFELLGELAGRTDAVAERSPGASSMQRFMLRSSFPSVVPASSAHDAMIPITIRSSPSFSDISERIWPATFALVDALLLLAPAIGACDPRIAKTSHESDADRPMWGCIELGSGTGLAGISLARASKCCKLPTAAGADSGAAICCRCGEGSSRCCCMRIANVTLTDGCAERGVPLLRANASLTTNGVSGLTDASVCHHDAAAGAVLSVPLCVHHWRWGDELVSGEDEASPTCASPATCNAGEHAATAVIATGRERHDIDTGMSCPAQPCTSSCVSALPSAARAFLFGSDLVYDPGIAAELVKTLQTQLRPRRCTFPSDAAVPGSWHEHLAQVLQADDAVGTVSPVAGRDPEDACRASAVAGYAARTFCPWSACSPTCAGGTTSPPAFFLLCSTMRNRETYASFVDGLLRAGLVYYDVTDEVETLRGGHSPAGESADHRALRDEAAVKHYVSTAGVLPPAVSSEHHTALLHFSSVWEALLRRAGSAADDAHARALSAGLVSPPTAVSSAQLPSVVAVVLPPLQQSF